VGKQQPVAFGFPPKGPHFTLVLSHMEAFSDLIKVNQVQEVTLKGQNGRDIPNCELIITGHYFTLHCDGKEELKVKQVLPYLFTVDALGAS